MSETQPTPASPLVNHTADFLAEKYVELHQRVSDHWFTLVLAVSAWLCAGAWWLHAHPQFVVSAIFKGF